MRSYETMIIVHPEVTGDAYQAVIEKFKGVLSNHGTETIAVDDWGMRPLAYPIRKQNRGSYVLLNHESKPEVIAEFERLLRIDDAVMKFQTVQADAPTAQSEQVVIDADTEEAKADADEE